MALLYLPDLSAPLDLEDGAELRVVADDHIPIGCHAGHCAICMVRVEQGAEHLSPVDDTERYTLSQSELDEGIRLACRVRILGGVVRLVPC
jgi:ferredoxin